MVCVTTAYFATSFGWVPVATVMPPWVTPPIIGNAYASDEELKQLAAVDRYKLSLGIEFVLQATELEKRS